MSKSSISFIFSILLWCLPMQRVAAQQVDDKVAQALQETLDSMFQVLNINGLSASLQFYNDAIWTGASGVSTFSPPDSIGPAHTFATGSTAKTITAACILQLVDEGVLSLEDSLHAWLPEFDHINPNITILQLLRHQSGISDVLMNPDFQPFLLINPSNIWTLESVINTFAQAPNFDAGTNWGYSNTNYLLLGMIITAATGMPYYQAFEERFFMPLGLESFALPSANPLPDEIAHLWLDLNGNGQVDDAHTFFTSWYSLFSSVGPAGGYFAKPSDMAQWMRAAMNGSLYTAATWELAQQTVATGLPGGTDYGLGLMERNFLGLRSLGHGGDISYSSSVFYFPEKDLSIAVHANDARINSWALAGTIEALLQTYLDCEAIITPIKTLSSSAFSIRIFPNPFIHKLTINIETVIAMPDLELQITNLEGKNIWTSKVSAKMGNNVFDVPLSPLSDLPLGLYSLNAFYKNKMVHSSKLIKK